jgi:hypothetical protein
MSDGTAEVDAAVAALRSLGDATVDRLLRENERHWVSMSAADRRTAELMARTVAARLLDRPARRLDGDGVSALLVLFGIDGGASPPELARRSESG